MLVLVGVWRCAAERARARGLFEVMTAEKGQPAEGVVGSLKPCKLVTSAAIPIIIVKKCISCSMKKRELLQSFYR